MPELERLKDVTVLDLDGEAHVLDSLWAEGPTVIVWLRHYG